MYTYYDLHYLTNNGTNEIKVPFETREDANEFISEYKASLAYTNKSYTLHKVVRKGYREIVSDRIVEAWLED